MNDHETVVKKDLDVPNTYHATGNASAMLANRLSWFYDLSGPSVTVNTACSGSLGLVCGSNLIFAPENTSGLSNLNFLSPDGKCYAFDEKANGYARGEGIACVIIKSLAAALEDGDTIRAIIRATGVNSDGRTPGITQPKLEAQVSLIRETYSRFGLDSSSTRYFEAHGTGTKLGDPLEASAIAEVFKTQQRKGERLYVGALKSNIGHLEGASGLAGIIKTILVLETAYIPPNIWLDQVNPMIKGEWGLEFPATGQPYPGEDNRRASINSFGFGGTNAHAVLDDAENFLRVRKLNGNLSSWARRRNLPTTSRVFDPKLLVFSTAHEAGLRQLQTEYSAHFMTQNVGAEHLSDIAYTLCKNRTHFSWRSFSVCESLDNTDKFIFSKPVKTHEKLRLCFLFEGQGFLAAGMARELITYKAFRRSMEHSDSILRAIGCQFSIIEKLWSDDELCNSDLNRPEFVQPIYTALQIALVELLENWCIRPYAVLGQSSGEIAAAYCAGILSKSQAVELAYWRGMALAADMQATSEMSGVLTVRHQLEEGKTLLLNGGDSMPSQSAQITPCNNSAHLTFLDERPKMKVGVSVREADDLVAEVLHDSSPYCNSQNMQRVRSVFKALTQKMFSGDHEGLKPSTLSCSFASGFYGKVFGTGSSTAKFCTCDYWINNLVCPSQFTEAMTAMRAACDDANASTVTHFLGIPTTDSMAGSVLHKEWDSEALYSVVLSQHQSALTTAMNLAGRLHCLGCPVDLVAVNQLFMGEGKKYRRLDDFPTYPFDHSKGYWLESRISKGFRFRRFPHHGFIGTTALDWNPFEPHWNQRLSLWKYPYLEDHRVAGVVVCPAAAMLVMVIEATRQLQITSRCLKGYRFRQVKFSKLLIISRSSQGSETQLYLRKEDDCNSDLTAYVFRLYVKENEEWCLCSQGSITLQYHDIDLGSRDTAIADHEHITHSCSLPITRDGFYRNLHNLGLQYGPAFQGLNRISIGDRLNGSGEINLEKQDAIKGGNHSIHPTTLDSLFQVAFSGLNRGCEIELPIYVPTEIESLWLSADVSGGMQEKSHIQVSSEVTMQGPRAYSANYVSLWKHNKQPLMIGDLIFTSIGGTQKLNPVRHDAVSLYRVVWKPEVNFLASGSELLPSTVDKERSVPNQIKNVPLTEIACCLAISDVLKAIGKEDELAEQPKHLQKYLNWMRHHANSFESSNFDEHASFRDSKLLKSKDQLFDEVEKLGPEGKLIVRLAKTLEPIVRGTANALEILFEDETLTEYYCQKNPPPEVYTSVENYVDLMAHENPHLRILEIGGGTGSMTRRVLKTLSVSDVRYEKHEEPKSRFSEYVFTDVSPAFFRKADESFGGEGFLCRALDIEKEPNVQGFEVGLYDVIIASNVLHATQNLQSTLRNTRKLLKANGKLLLIEGINPDVLRTSFIFGSLPGWWLSTEPFRKKGPLVSHKTWDKLLRENEFTGVDLLVGDANYLSCLMVSTACESSNGERNPNFGGSKLSIIRGAQSTLQNALALSIEDASIRSGIQVSIIDAEDTSKYADGTSVFLQTLDHFSFEGIKEKQLKLLKQTFQSHRNVLWLTRRSSNRTDVLEHDAVQGLSQAILSENEDLKLVTLGLEKFDEISNAAHQIWKVLRQYFLQTADPAQNQTGCEQIIEKDGALCVSRVLPAKNLENVILESSTQGTAVNLSSNATYVISGGLGGLGRSIIEWMVSLGARNLLLLSRRGARDSNAVSFLEKIMATGTSVVAEQCDIGDENRIKEVLEQAARHMPPIRGCIQASMVLRSSMFQSLTLDRWKQTIQAKVGGSLNLHRHLPSTLDFYILLSSVCGIIGAAGQSNYAFGCAYQDALARHNATVGQKAVSIDLGIVAGIGYMTSHPVEDSLMRSIGMQPISERYLHAMLGYHCNPDRERRGAEDSQVVAGIMTEDEMRRKGLVRPRFLSRPLWKHLTSPPKRHLGRKKIPSEVIQQQQQEQPDLPSVGRGNSTTPTAGASIQSQSSETRTSIRSSVIEQLRIYVSDMLSIPAAEIDVSRPLQAFGVDSLVAMELRNWFREKLDRDVGASDILEGGSILSLAEKAFLGA
ncbi:MAG: hypothetical protein Q9201_002481 [Fulgogasparrea decipioides]